MSSSLCFRHARRQNALDIEASGRAQRDNAAPMKSEPDNPMTLGNAAAAHLRFIVWCLDCRHQVEPDHGEWPSGRHGLFVRDAAAGALVCL
jgi:hypothetical protein